MPSDLTNASYMALASPRPKRLLLAFLLAPLAGPVGISIGMAVPWVIESGNPMFLLSGLPLIYIIATPFVYFFSIVVGLPAFLLLHLSLGLSRPKLIVVWAVVGMVSLFCLTGFQLPGRAQDLLLYMPFALGGAAVGYAFWVILTAPTRGAGQRPTANGQRPTAI